MFDLTSSKLLILAVVALIVVGPKDLPALLRTIGRYVGMIRRQANEFRSQFEEAMRDSEIADLHKEVEQLGREANASLAEASRSVDHEVNALNQSVGETLHEPTAAQGVADGTTDATSPAGDTLAPLQIPDQPALFDAAGIVPAELQAPVAPVPAQPRALSAAEHRPDHETAGAEPASARGGA